MQKLINIPKCDFNLFDPAVLEVITKANRLGLADHEWDRNLDLVSMMANYQVYFRGNLKELVNILVANLNYGYKLAEPLDKTPFDNVGMTYYITNHFTRQEGEERHWMLELKTHALKKAFLQLAAKVADAQTPKE